MVVRSHVDEISDGYLKKYVQGDYSLSEKRSVSVNKKIFLNIFLPRLFQSIF